MKSLSLSDYNQANKPTKKPLYLLSKEPSLLLYKDRSLVLFAPEKAERRFPLTRIDRIVANQFVRWSGAAIMASLIHKIPITWVNSSMQSVGHAAPRQPREYDLNDTIAILVENDDWQELYANLLKSLRQVVLDRVFKDIEPEERFSNSNYQFLKKEFVYRNHFEVQLPSSMHAVCESYIVKQLEMAELKHHYVAVDGNVLSIANDLSELLWAMINLDIKYKIKGASYAQMYAIEKWLSANPYVVAEFLYHIRVKIIQNEYASL